MYAPVLIDSDGEIRSIGAPEMRRGAIADGCGCDSDWPDCAVREFGFVLVRERLTSVQIMLRPSLVTEPALAALFYHVAEAVPERVVLSFLLDEWHHEVIRTAHEAMLRLEDIVFAAKTWRPRTRYQAQFHPSKLLRHATYQRWAPLLAVWGLTGGRPPGSLVDVFTSFSLLDRAIVLRNPRGSDRLLFEHRGSAFSFFRPCWNLLAIGRDIEDQPDGEYAASVAEAYRTALGTREPRFEAVDAVVRTPGRDVRRSRYDRLILPWQSANGERFVTGLSMLRTSYALDSA